MIDSLNTPELRMRLRDFEIAEHWLREYKANMLNLAPGELLRITTASEGCDAGVVRYVEEDPKRANYLMVLPRHNAPAPVSADMSFCRRLVLHQLFCLACKLEGKHQIKRRVSYVHIKADGLCQEHYNACIRGEVVPGFSGRISTDDFWQLALDETLHWRKKA